MSDYTDPKTDWNSDNTVSEVDFNRIEKNIKVLKDEEVEVKGTKTFIDGLVVEVRTDDPISPEVGRIWLRSDL